MFLDLEGSRNSTLIKHYIETSVSCSKAREQNSRTTIKTYKNQHFEKKIAGISVSLLTSFFPCEISSFIWINLHELIHIPCCLIKTNEGIKEILHVFRSSPPEVFLEKGVLKICSKFTGEHLCRSAKIYCIFSEHLFVRTSLEGCLCVFSFAKNRVEEIKEMAPIKQLKNTWRKCY